MNKEKKEVSKEDFALIQMLKSNKFEKEDFELLFTLKGNKFTVEDLKELERLRDIKQEDKQRTRLRSIEINEKKIKQTQREIEFRKGQIKNKKSLEKHESFVGGVKPFWYLLNDIEDSLDVIKQLEQLNINLKEEYDKDKKGD